jgi:hypothetical protein
LAITYLNRTTISISSPIEDSFLRILLSGIPCEDPLNTPLANQYFYQISIPEIANKSSAKIESIPLMRKKAKKIDAA